MGLECDFVLGIVIGSGALLSIHTSSWISRYRIYKLKIIVGYKFYKTVSQQKHKNTNLS